MSHRGMPTRRETRHKRTHTHTHAYSIPPVPIDRGRRRLAGQTRCGRGTGIVAIVVVMSAVIMVDVAMQGRTN